MKFSTTFSVALLALAKLIVADSEQFGLITIRSGSSLQYASVYLDDNKLYLGSGGDSLGGTVTDAGKLKLTDGKYAVVNSDGSIGEGSEDEGTGNFSIKDGYLAYDDKNGFNAISQDSKYLLSVSSAEGSTGVALKAIGSGSQSVPDFTPSGSSDTTTTTLSSSSASAASSTSIETASSAQSAQTSTEAAATSAEAISQIDDGQIQAVTSTTEAVSQISDGQVQATSSAAATSSVNAASQISDGQIQVVESNGAPKAAIGLGAGAFAAAALLL